MAFAKLYKGLNRFFPGDTLQLLFRDDKDVELDQESLTVLKSILLRKKSKIIQKNTKVVPWEKVELCQKTNTISMPIPELQLHRIKIPQIFE